MGHQEYLDREKARQAATEIMQHLNPIAKDQQLLIDAIGMEHRTLQQRFTELCRLWLLHCAVSCYGRDGRNEASHQLGKKLKPLLERYPLPYI